MFVIEEVELDERVKMRLARTTASCIAFTAPANDEENVKICKFFFPRLICFIRE